MNAVTQPHTQTHTQTQAQTRHDRHRIVICGAGGRDFHNFNTVYRDDPTYEVVAFTASQIPGIDDRWYPPSLAGPLYPRGIPIVPERTLGEVLAASCVDEVVLAYSDLRHVDVMHIASIALAAGADFQLLGPRSTMIDLPVPVPVLAVCAARTGSGKSQISRYLARLLRASGREVAFVRHPMPYGNLQAMRVQRFVTMGDLEAARVTIEEREEYEEPLRHGVTVFAGVDYAEVGAAAAAQCDVVVWDGGNNDFPFFTPDLLIAVVDALRPGHELEYHPGEAVVRMADVVVVNKVDAAPVDAVERVLADVAMLNPNAIVVRTSSPVTLDPGPPLSGMNVVVVEDGPTITHGGMPFGAGMVAASAAGAKVIDPRRFAVGSVAATFASFPHIGHVIAAMGYSAEQMADLRATLEASGCDAVVCGTPVDLGRLLRLTRPVRQARYDVADAGSPSLDEVLARFLDGVTPGGASTRRWRGSR